MRQADQRCYLGKKIQDDNGATLFIALLFFIICATCGAVLLVAGTQAAGRIAGLTKNEQNLYAATSAAKMLKDEIDGRTVTVDKDKNYIVTPKPSQLLTGNSGLLKNLTDYCLARQNSGPYDYDMTVSGYNGLRANIKITVHYANQNDTAGENYVTMICSSGEENKQDKENDDNQVTSYVKLPFAVSDDGTQVTWSGGLVSSEEQ